MKQLPATDFSSTPSALWAALRSFEHIAIASHYNPDADAYGSSLGLMHALQGIGKTCTIFNESGQVDRYTSLPGLDTIIDDQRLILNSECLVVCDCAAWSRLGDTFKGVLERFKLVINIDHHVSNEGYGHLSYVIPKASSTSEIICELLTTWGVPITKESAHCLMAGIMGDTGSFKYASTSIDTFRTAATLMELGADPSVISKELFDSIPLSSVRLQAEALLAAQFYFDGAYGEVVADYDLIKKYNATMEDTDGLVEKVRDIKGVKISASMRQDGHIWRVSLRSTSPEFNVSAIASEFGGGGHTVAAAFRSSKKVSLIQEKLRALVSTTLGL